ncbi:alanine racemase [Microcella sp.]|uniref:alanine racemase n=1 Tax=Microcella sp. TaxID=1913979 RepID=UPI00256302F9|nr:alanine racemase [Microcella sp.]MBX9470929.1 alanine racemase [Microcella sp.]
MSALAIIDHVAFAHNVGVLSARVAPSEVMLAVKANAYGHGMREIAATALVSGATSLAVLEIPAAVTLREAGVECRLFAWLHGIDSDFDAAVDHRVDLGVSAHWQLERIAHASTRENPGRVHLKIDTGLHRNGALPENWPELVTAARTFREQGLVTIEGIWSHLADASPDDDARAVHAYAEALQTAEVLGVKPVMRHLAASSAGWREPRARYDAVRFGIAAYGISPFDDVTGQGMGLRAVMTLQCAVSPDPAPSGRRWITAGYAQGVPLGAREAEVSIGHQRCAVENVELARTLVVAPDRLDDDAIVTVFGEPETGVPSAEDWARWSGTIGDEIVTGVPSRVERRHDHGRAARSAG